MAGWFFRFADREHNITTTPQLDPRTGITRRIADLPGPRGLPLLGNLLQVRRDTLHLQVERWAAQYGDAFRFRLGARGFLVLSDPGAIAAILHDRPNGFHRTERLVEAAEEYGFTGVFSANGEAWQRQRSLVMSGLEPTRVADYFPTLARVTARLAQRWRLAAQQGEEIDMRAELMHYSIDVAVGLAFGVDSNTIQSGFEPLQAHLDKLLPALFKRLVAPWKFWRFSGMVASPEHGIDLHVSALRLTAGDLIAAARRRMAANPKLRERPANLIEAMIVARDTRGSGVTDEDVQGNVLTLLLAGEDTAGTTLCWLIWLLHQNPEAAARLRQEVRGVLGSQGMPTHQAQLKELPYLDACMHETLRLRPVVPINMQQAARDTVVAGLQIPAGTVVMCLARTPGMDPAHFADPHVFRPERWLQDGCPAASARRLVPFGAGPRICPGRHLALAELRMAIAMLYGSFEGAKVWVEGGGPVRERLALTMSPVGLRMRLQPRSQAFDAA